MRMTTPIASVAVLSTAVVLLAAPPNVPLCPGLTVVTSITQPEGDYESIKTVEAVDGSTVRIKYSSEQPPEKVGGGVRIRKLNASRVVRIADLINAKAYEQVFGTNIPAEIPATTAIGTSRAVLTDLKTKGEADLTLFEIPSASTGSSAKLPTDPKQHPSVFDYTEIYKLRRAESTPVKVPIIVNGAKTELPAIHANGRSDFYGYKAEFFFLDDEDNPIALKWRLGIGAATGEKAGGDRNTLQVVKLSYSCSGSAAKQSVLEQALAETGRVDVYDVYFSFNSDELREESEPTLQEIGDILRRHPDWKLSIAGHTDNIGGDTPNLDLSKRRAAAVKNALVTQFGVNTARLTTTGFGRSRPVDTNDTPEGRAHNRRVELMRQ
jgi:outer membrane protein OmpA-like peptidoglycan-associated protein